MATQTQECSVRLHRQGDTATFQVSGMARMHQSTPIRQLGEQLLVEGVTTLRVDLRHCTYLDSTFLGTLLLLRRNVQRHHGCKFLIVSPSPECCRLFKQMGIEDCLPCVTDAPAPVEECRPVPCEASVEAFNRNVVQAHEELANLGGPAGKTFERVARGLNNSRCDDIP